MLNKHRFVKTGTALAVITMLGACASTGTANRSPQTPLEKLGSSATETGNRIWAGTKHLFKLKDRSKDNQLADDYFDEIDIAAGDIKEYEDTIAEVDTTAIQPLPEVELLSTNNQDSDSADITLVDAEESTQQDTENNPAASSEQYAPATDDLFHTVGQDESMWFLAKMLTGDANNWRVLAQINGLGEDGALKIGQSIRVPGALKRVPVDGQEQVIAAATTDTTVADSSQDIPTQTVTVNAGENMWFLAKRTTGNAANWTKIAEANGMTESQASLIRYGQEIKIPVNLISADIAQSADQSDIQAEAAEAVADAIEPKQAQSLAENSNTEADAEAVVLASASDLPANKELASDLPANKELVTVEANFQGNPAKLELARNAETGEQTAEADDDGIMVSGTYYPKAVYNKADFSSSLLMRVSPGTRLAVSKAVGPWYEVMTEKGVGYVHSRDTK